MTWALIYLHQIVIVNLSAFVLAGSHLVLSSTKAESILVTVECYIVTLKNFNRRVRGGEKLFLHSSFRVSPVI